jgi:hypothetical protein
MASLQLPLGDECHGAWSPSGSLSFAALKGRATDGPVLTICVQKRTVAKRPLPALANSKKAADLASGLAALYGQ